MPFDPSIILTNVADGSSWSSVWTDSLQGKRSFTIAKTWDGNSLLANETVQLDISINANNNTMSLTVRAPWYYDALPNADYGPYSNLSKHEVVHFFLLNDKNESLEIQYGPYVIKTFYTKFIFLFSCAASFASIYFSSGTATICWCLDHIGMNLRIPEDS